MSCKGASNGPGRCRQQVDSEPQVPILRRTGPGSHRLESLFTIAYTLGLDPSSSLIADANISSVGLRNATMIENDGSMARRLCFGRIECLFVVEFDLLSSEVLYVLKL